MGKAAAAYLVTQVHMLLYLCTTNLTLLYSHPTLKLRPCSFKIRKHGRRDTP